MSKRVRESEEDAGGQALRTSEDTGVRHLEVYCVPAIAAVLLVPENAEPESSPGYAYALAADFDGSPYTSLPSFPLKSNPAGYIAPVIAGGVRAGFTGPFFPHVRAALVRDCSFRAEVLADDARRMICLGWLETDALSLLECELVLAAKEITENPGMPRVDASIARTLQTAFAPVPVPVLKSWLLLAGERLEQQGILANVGLSLMGI